MAAVLVITGRTTCCESLTPKESSALEQAIQNSDPWLQSVASLAPEEYGEYVTRILEKHVSDPIVICVDVQPALALKIAFMAGTKNHQGTYFMNQDGTLAKI